LADALKRFEKLGKAKVDFKTDKEKDKDTFEVTLVPTITSY
jgi:hypothetical protein